MSKKKLLAIAFKDTIPIMTGYVFLGIGFGVLLKTSGYSIWWALFMSVFIYAGSMQYAAIGLLTGGASFVTVALTTLMVNARHFFYGLSMIDRYRDTGIKKPYLMHALTDETYSLVCKDIDNVEKPDLKKYYFMVSLMDQIYWVTGSVIGAGLGSIIKFNTKGIDFALTALFVTVFTDQWLKSRNHFAAIVGISASILCRVIFGSSNFLIPSMILIAVFLLSGKKFSGVAKEGEVATDDND